MKNALILHGTGSNPEDHWFPWLKSQLELKGYKVWVPQLPKSETPNIEDYNKFLLSDGWQLDQDTVIIGHSSGAVAVLGLLQALPEKTKVNTCILVGSFNDDLDWPNLKELFKVPFDWQKIKSKARKIIFIHSDDDPHCPLEHAQFQAKQLNAQLIIKPGQKHFSIDTAGEQYKQFPFLLELLENEA